ncbi:MAG: rod shape-determining protein MreD [Clostridia bacterium]|nr:rod shape-determining protein MreD [Clostridia bacterium]
MKKLENSQKYNIFKRIFWFFAIVICAIFQNTPHFQIEIFGSRALLLIPVVIAISMFEKPYISMIFGAFAGTLWDLVSSHYDGRYMLLLFILSAVVGLLITSLIRNNIVTFMLLSSVSEFLLIFFNYLSGLISGKGDFLASFVRFYLPTYLYTLILSPLIYIIFRMAIRKIKEKYLTKVNMEFLK